MRELKRNRMNESDSRYFNGYTDNTVPNVPYGTGGIPQYNPMVVNDRIELMDDVIKKLEDYWYSEDPKLEDEVTRITKKEEVLYIKDISWELDNPDVVTVKFGLVAFDGSNDRVAETREIEINFENFLGRDIEGDLVIFISKKIKSMLDGVLHGGLYNENKEMRKTKRSLESRGIRRRFTESEESNVIYTAKKAWFDSEEDSYEKGVIDSGVSWDINLDLSANSLEDLFKKVQKSLYMNGKGYSWGVELSDMNGETCFLVEYEGDENNDLASDSQIDDWKNGDERLWLVRGRVRVMKAIKPSNVPDEEMEAFARANGLDIL